MAQRYCAVKENEAAELLAPANSVIPACQSFHVGSFMLRPTQTRSAAAKKLSQARSDREREFKMSVQIQLLPSPERSTADSRARVAGKAEKPRKAQQQHRWRSREKTNELDGKRGRQDVEQDL